VVGRMMEFGFGVQSDILLMSSWLLLSLRRPARGGGPLLGAII
jgi:hypothetical protein